MTYGNSSWLGRTGHEGPLGEVAVADVAPAGAAHRLVLAGAVRREVVVVDVALLGLGADRVDPLDVRGRAERGDGQRLRLAAGEQARAVGARQEADLDRDRSDVGQAAAVDADALVDDDPADGLLLDEAEEALADARLAASRLEQRVGVAALPLARGRRRRSTREAWRSGRAGRWRTTAGGSRSPRRPGARDGSGRARSRRSGPGPGACTTRRRDSPRGR